MHINRLLETGRIRECQTPWLSPLLVIRKPKSGEIRIVIDYREVNKVVVNDVMPLPPIDQVLNAIGTRKYKTTIDIRQAFFQCALSPESQPVTGFAVNLPGIACNSYCWTVVPFGLRTSTALFTRALARILTGLEKHAINYVDDIVISNETFEEHLITLRKVLQRLRDFNIKISGTKCEVARTKISFLGHELGSSDYRPGLRNVRAIIDFPVPKTTKEVQRFLGMGNFYRKFIMNFAEIASPLYQIVKNKTKFEWKKEQQFAFDEIRKYLTSSPCLAFPRDDSFELHVDASTVSVGSSLMQRRSKDSKDLVAIGYYSKTLSDSQRKQSPTQLELFAIISSLRFFKHLIYGNFCLIKSDHKPLSFILNHNVINDTLSRWVVELNSFDCAVEYIKGSRNLVADCLSRIDNPKVKFVDDTPETEDIVEFPVCLSVMPDYFLPPPAIIATINGKIKSVDILQAQLEDETCKEIMNLITRGNESFTSPDISLIALAEHCKIRKNGCLYRRRLSTEDPRLDAERLFIPESLKEYIVTSFHDRSDSGGHFNWKKTLSKVMRRYYWPNMHVFIRERCMACVMCQRKRSNLMNKETLNPTHSRAIFQKVYLDLTGPIHRSESGQSYVLGAICHFSKFVIAIPIPDCTAITVAKVLMNEIILKYGTMTRLVTDNASYLKGDLMKEITRLMGVDHHFTSANRHESSGEIERVFNTFHAMLRTYTAANQLDWDLHLPAISLAYNTTTHSSTGETPFFLFFGRDPIFTADLVFEEPERPFFTGIDDVSIYKASLLSSLQSAWKIAYNNTQKASEAFIKQRNKTHLKPLEIEVGDIVLPRDLTSKIGISKKLTLPWLGSYRVIAVNHPRITIVSMSAPQSKPRTLHKDLVKKCRIFSGPTVTRTNISEEENLSTDEDDTTPAIPGYDHEVEPTTKSPISSPPPSPTPDLHDSTEEISVPSQSPEPLVARKSALKSTESSSHPTYNLRNRKLLKAPNFYFPS